jgi:hypothetical protein
MRIQLRDGIACREICFKFIFLIQLLYSQLTNFKLSPENYATNSLYTDREESFELIMLIDDVEYYFPT